MVDLTIKLILGVNGKISSIGISKEQGVEALCCVLQVVDNREQLLPKQGNLRGNLKPFSSVRSMCTTLQINEKHFREENMEN